MLGRLIKPRWQHRDPAIRARAVDQLEPGNEDDARVLATLARGDASAIVRAAAAKRLTDLQLLGDMVEKDSANEVKESATHQVERLLAGLVEGGPGLENRVRLLNLTDNQRALRFVALESPDQACRLAAVERLEDPDELLRLAVDGSDEPLRVAAAKQLGSPEHLKRLVREGRDKRVLRHARDNLKARQEEAARREKLLGELAHLEEQLQRLANETPDKLYGPRLQQLDHQWYALQSEADEAAHKRTESLLAQCHRKHHEWEKAAEDSRRREQADSEHRGTIADLERMFAEINPETWDGGAGSLRALLDTQERRWQNASDFVAPEEALARRFAELHEQFKTLLEAAAAIAAGEEELQAQLEKLRAGELADEERDRLRERLPEWPLDVPAPALLSELLERLAPEAAPVKAAAQQPGKDSRNEDAHRVLGALRRELGKRNLRHANRLWHKAEALLQEHPDPSARARMEKLQPELDELRDWHDFAAEPKKEDLCQRMEALAREEMDPEEKATAIQALHDEWRDLMSSDQERDQSLWDRFKAASDAAYEPCREHFRELDAERAENLARREALCRQLEEFIEGRDWENADWPAVWQIRQKAPAEWKSYQPVRFTDAREAQRRFSSLLEQLDARLREATDRHRPERDRLLGELEAAAELEDKEEAARQARHLQDHWRKAGWVHPNVYRGMNRRFRRLMDGIFEARNSARDERREAAEGRRQEVEEALERATPLLEQNPAEMDPAALQQALDELSALDCPPAARETKRTLEETQHRLRRNLQALPRWRGWQSLYDRVSSATSADADDALQRQLAVALEVLAGVESPEDAREERMAWQLEKLPKAMTAGGDGDALEEVTRLVEDAEFEALEETIRRRLLAALEAIEPRV